MVTATTTTSKRHEKRLRTGRRISGGPPVATMIEVMLAGDNERERAAADAARALRPRPPDARRALEPHGAGADRALPRGFARRACRAAGPPGSARARGAGARDGAGSASHGGTRPVHGCLSRLQPVLLVVLGLTLLIHGASNSELLAFLLIWLVPTFSCRGLVRPATAVATSVGAADARTLHGACACGAVRYEVADAFLYAANCHCSRCRAATGTAFKAFAGIEREKLAITAGADGC